MAAPKKVDYEQIEPEWRAGVKTPAQLAAEYAQATGISVSHTAIIKHFKKLGVPRDLSKKVQEKANAMVLQAMVTGKVSTETTKRDSEIINDGATLVAEVRLSHRQDIGKARKLAMSLFSELEGQTDGIDLLKQLAEVMYAPDENGQDKRNDLFNKVISLGGRVGSMKSLSDALKTLIALEREAFGIDDKRAATATGDINISF